MKNALFSPFFIVLLFISMIHSSTISFAQTLETYRLETQEDVNGFIDNCDCLDANGHLDGDLYIGVAPLKSDISDLSPLSGITSIEGDLLIQKMEMLTSLEGLEQLTVVRKNVTISKLMIRDLKGLDNLERIEGAFDLGFNEALTQLSGLEKLTFIGWFMCRNNPVLEDLQGLSGLETVAEDLILAEAGTISSLAGLENLTYVGHGIGIAGCANLQSLDGLGRLKLDTLDERARSIITINRNPELVSIAALANLETDWNITIEISNNAQLADLEGLEGGRIMQDINIQTNESLESLEALSGVELVSNLGIVNNPQLTDLAGLEQLRHVKGNLNILLQSQFTNLKALSELTRVDAAFGLANNTQLISLEGLEKLEFIGTDLSIVQNEQLIDLDALSQVATIGQNLAIVNNAQLSACCLVDCWVENDVVQAIYTVEMNQTDGFCNALPDIAANCETTECRTTNNVGTNIKGTSSDPSRLQIFQENNQISILRNSNSSSTNATIKVYHLTGQLMEQQTLPSNHSIIDMSHYATGTYIVVLEAEGERQVERLVKW